MKLIVQINNLILVVLVLMTSFANAQDTQSEKIREAEVRYAEGFLLVNSGENEAALENFKVAVRDNPADSTYRTFGHLYTLLGDHESGISDLNTAVELDPYNPVSYYTRAQGFYQIEDYRLAIEDLSRAVELNPYYMDAFESRSMAYEKIGDEGQAEADIQKVKELQQLFDQQ